MTAPAAVAGAERPKVRNLAVLRSDRLVSFPQAARRLGRSPDTIRAWHDAGHLPAVTTPGGQWSTFESFIAAILASARPGEAGSIEDIARAWFAERGLSPGAVA
jgi:hypothetical protein